MRTRTYAKSRHFPRVPVGRLPPVKPRLRPPSPFLLALAVLLAVGGCGNNKARTARDVRPAVVRDVPAVLSGTIGSEVNVRRAEPTLVSGYGLVVGLSGTGGGVTDERISLTMEREMALRGVGKGSDEFKGTPFEGLTPRELLRRPDVAIAVVYAAIPLGTPEGAEFDVYVRSVNNSGTASLEGGTLWTTDLHVGPPTSFEGYQTRKVGAARGPVFINPFAEPPRPGEDDPIIRSVGRVLGGGVVTSSTDIALLLDNPSHSRARAIQEAIRSRFPEGPGDTGPTARGRTDSVIDVRVPRQYRDRAGEFLDLLLHTPIDMSFPQERARRYVQAMEEQPGLVGNITWCLEALGQPAVPFVREVYDSPELATRLGALRAGVGLQDARAAASLTDLARTGPPGIRSDAILMLGKLDAGPTVDLALRNLLAEEELDIRVAAYEALASRAEKIAMNRRGLSRRATSATLVVSEPQTERLDRIALAGGAIQGVQRTVIGDKFLLDQVPAGDPLIYITQQGTPRVTLLGANLDLPRPLLVSAWSGRLMLAADSPTDDVRVYYRDPRTERATTGKPGNTLPELVKFMAHTPTPEQPEPGLAMTYSEVVGALYAIQQAGGVQAAFATEQDRLLAVLLKSSQAPGVEERPETPGDEPALRVYEPVQPAQPQTPPEKPTLVEPLPPRTTSSTKP